MPFFKRILNFSDSETAPNEKRGRLRYAPNAQFPLKAVLNLTGRDDTGAELQNRHGGLGWDWSGRLVNFSDHGARMQLPASVSAARGDACHLKLTLEGYRLVIPGCISNIKEQHDSVFYGLTLDVKEPGTQLAYRQLIELVALGCTLKPSAKAAKRDDSGYLLEQYTGAAHSRLKVWRGQADKIVTAFEFLLKDCLVRAAQGHRAEYLVGADPAEARQASGSKSTEIHRLFHWVVPNLAPVVPADVRAFLQHYAA